MIRGILFDLDMTLVDFMTMKRVATAEAAAGMIGAGLDCNVDDLRHELFDFYMNYGIESHSWITDYLKKHDAFTDEIEAAGITAYRRVKTAFLEPFPGVYPTFIQLIKKGVKLGIVTDAPRQKAHMRLAGMRLNFFFDVIVTDANKPNEKGFLEAVDALELKPEEVLMVGDWPEKDVVGAHNAGLKTCLAMYGMTGQGFQEVGIAPDYRINKFEELLGFIE